MRGNILPRVVIVTAIVMVAAFAIAGIIGVRAGIFRDIAAGRLPFSRKGSTSTVTIQVPAAELERVAIVDSVSGYVTIREGAGDAIKAWYHEPENTTTPAGEPLFKGKYQAGAAEIRLEWKRHTPIGRSNTGAWLEVTLPRGYAGALSVDAVSARIELEDHAYSDLALSTVSGVVRADAIQAKRFTLRMTSGSVSLQRLRAERTVISSVSGNIDIGELTGDADIHSISGTVAIAFAKTPGTVAVETVSGDIRLNLPKDAGFTLDARSISGAVTCDFPITLSGSRMGAGEHRIAGTVGNGRSTISARTISGNISITRGKRDQTP